MKEFKCKVALITGAGNGFGAEFAKEAAKRGMKLFLADIDENDLKRTEETVRNMGAEVGTIVADVSLEDEVDAMVKACMEAYGRIDLLINNAGVATPGRIEDLPTRDWHWIVETNCMSHIYSMQRVIPIMKARGSGYILNVASVAGLTAMNHMPAYFATKHFVVGLSESVYYDLMEQGANIGMSVFCPSFVQTDIHNCERHRPKRFMAPEDAYYSSEHYKYGQELAKYTITHGTKLDEAAPYVFKAIEKNHFYIVLHPETKILIKHRNRDIAAERNPDYEYIKCMNDIIYGKKDLKTILTVARKR